MQARLEGATPFRIGVDLGGTNIKAGVVNEHGDILATATVKTLSQRPWQQVAEDMVRCAGQAMESAGITAMQCRGLGIGVPGAVDSARGCVVYFNNFSAWEDVPLGRYMEKALSLPVVLGNDANCAALGEYLAGAAKGRDSALMITLGTGVGGAYVQKGAVFEGGGVGAMEVGHIILRQGGEACTCGRRGCWEAYSSATALIRDAKRMALAHPESLLNSMCADLGKMDGRIPFQAARSGDEWAQKLVQDYIMYLGEGLVDVINLFRPQIVLLSGGVSGEGRYLTEPLQRFVQEHIYGGARFLVPDIVVAALGNRAGIVGAAGLIS